MKLDEKFFRSRNVNAPGFIYKITNRQNAKVYIGLTSRTPDERWRGHQREAKRGSRSPLHLAIREFGRESFTLETLVKATVGELPDLEREKIAEYRSDDPERGYNAAPGGGLGGPTLGHEVFLNGVRFISRKAFSDHLGLNYELVRKMFSEGKTPEEIAQEGTARKGTGSQLCRSVVVNGVEYASVQIACDTLGVSRANVNYRLRKGWSLEEAFSPNKFTKNTSPKSGSIEFNGINYASLGALATAHGVQPSTVIRRVDSLGWPIERALSKEKFNKKGVVSGVVKC